MFWRALLNRLSLGLLFFTFAAAYALRSQSRRIP
jgi:hypothetical protein